MRNACSKTLNPQSGPALILQTMYHVRADRSYDVNRVPPGLGSTDLFRTVSGTGHLVLDDGEELTAGGDSVVMVATDRLVHYRCQGEDWTFWWFQFDLSGPIDLPAHQVLVIGSALSDEVQAHQCFQLLQEDCPQASAYASSLLSQLLSKWVWQRNLDASTPHQESIARVIAMMHSQMGQGLTVSAMARVAHLSERRFRQVFEKQTGFSPKRYYDRLRMETAGALLMTTPLGIGQLAETLGYSSLFHFSRAFKSHFGVPPSHYRKADRV